MPNADFETWGCGAGDESTLWAFLGQTALLLGASMSLSVPWVEVLIPPGQGVLAMSGWHTRGRCQRLCI